MIDTKIKSQYSERMNINLVTSTLSAIFAVGCLYLLILIIIIGIDIALTTTEKLQCSIPEKKIIKTIWALLGLPGFIYTYGVYYHFGNPLKISVTCL